MTSQSTTVDPFNLLTSELRKFRKTKMYDVVIPKLRVNRHTHIHTSPLPWLSEITMIDFDSLLFH